MLLLLSSSNFFKEHILIIFGFKVFTDAPSVFIIYKNTEFLITVYIFNTVDLKYNDELEISIIYRVILKQNDMNLWLNSIKEHFTALLK